MGKSGQTFYNSITQGRITKFELKWPGKMGNLFCRTINRVAFV